MARTNETFKSKGTLYKSMKRGKYKAKTPKEEYEVEDFEFLLLKRLDKLINVIENGR